MCSSVITRNHNIQDCRGWNVDPRRPQEHREMVSFHLFVRVGSRRSTFHDEEILVNSGWISPERRVQFTPIGASQTRDGGSAAFDFVSTYSNHHATGHRAATLQNRFTRTVPSAEGDEPFIRASIAALLSMRKTHVLRLPSDR